MRKARIAVLVSGGGTNLQAILDAQAAGKLPHGQVALVVSNRTGAYALERARAAGVEALTLTRKACGGQAGFEAALTEALAARGIELIVLAGFLSILSEDFTGRWPRRILNVHPSLIPAFCGAGFYGLKVDRRHGPFRQRDPGRRGDHLPEGRPNPAGGHPRSFAAPGHGAGGVETPAQGRGAGEQRDRKRAQGKSIKF